MANILEDIKDKIEKRIILVQEWKNDAVNGYVNHPDDDIISASTAAFNLSYGMEIEFLNELKSLITN